MKDIFKMPRKQAIFEILMLHYLKFDHPRSQGVKIKISSLDFWATLSRIRSDKAANYQRSPAELSRSRPGKRKHDVPTRKNHFFFSKFFQK